MHANVFHPALAAKMFTTLQDVSGGRAGMNIVNGSYAAEFARWASGIRRSRTTSATG